MTAHVPEELQEQLGEPLTFRGFRMPAFDLDHMLACAVQHAGKPDDAIPPLDALQLHAASDTLRVLATDTLTFFSERRAVNQEGDWSTFLLQRSDVRTLRALLRAGLSEQTKATKPLLPVDVEVGDTGFLEVYCEGRRASFSPRPVSEDEHFPVTGLDLIDEIEQGCHVGNLDDFDAGLSVDLIARLKPLHRAGYGVMRFRKDRREHGRTLLAAPMFPHEQHAGYDRDVRVLLTCSTPPRQRDTSGAAQL